MLRYWLTLVGGGAAGAGGVVCRGGRREFLEPNDTGSYGAPGTARSLVAVMLFGLFRIFARRLLHCVGSSYHGGEPPLAVCSQERPRWQFAPRAAYALALPKDKGVLPSGFPLSGVCQSTHQGQVEGPDGHDVDAAPAQAIGSTRGPETWGCLSLSPVVSWPGVRPIRAAQR